MNSDELRRELVAFIARESGISASQVELETRLFSAGLLDSMDLLKLVSFLESRCSIEVAALHISRDVFDSVDRIVAYAATRS